METIVQLDLRAYAALPDTLAARTGGTDTRPWLTYATRWQMLHLATRRRVIVHQHNDDAAVTVAARTLGNFLAAGKHTATLYRIGILPAPHTCVVHGDERGAPITLAAGRGLSLDYRRAGLRGSAVCADRAGVEPRRWAWYFARVQHVVLAAVPAPQLAHQDTQPAASYGWAWSAGSSAGSAECLPRVRIVRGLFQKGPRHQRV